MSGAEDKYDALLDLAKRRGFFWPSFEIYGGVSGYIDVGPLGVKLARRIEAEWLKFFVQRHGFLEVSTPVVMPESVFVASGHVEHFKDLMVTCKACQRRYKADYVITEALPGRNSSAVEGMKPNELDQFIAANLVRCPECGGELNKAEYFTTMFKTTIGPYSDLTGYGRPEAAQGMFIDFKRAYEIGRERLPLGIAQVGRVMRNEISPRQGPIRLREFTIMELELFFDPLEPKCDFMARVADVELPLLPAETRLKGEASISTVKPIEAVTQGLVRTDWCAYLMAVSVKFLKALGIPVERQRFEEKLESERSHYSAQTFDHQVNLDRWGWMELAGFAYRTDFDLSSHSKASGSELSVFKAYKTPTELKEIRITPIESILGPMLREKTREVIEALRKADPYEVKKSFEDRGYFNIGGVKILPSHVKVEERLIRESGRRVIPHVVEPSFGLERLLYSTLEQAYERAGDRVVLNLPFHLAPLEVAVFPLMTKDGIDRLASEIAELLTGGGFEVEYDESGSIGRRYARADEAGIPVVVTVDYQTLEDNTVTLRDRNTRRQVRNDWRSISGLVRRFLEEEVDFAGLGVSTKVSYEQT